MMTRRVYKCLLMVAAGMAITLGMVSCVDNIDNSTTPGDDQQEQQAQQQQEKTRKFWAVASQLVDVDDYTEDYADKTFEPVYGVEGSEAGTRYVYTNDAATAAARFADLVEVDDIDEDTQSYTYDDPDVGKLVYTKGTGKILATVDVDIKQIPTLKKIAYVPGAYANANFAGKAYYRFGDVVIRQVKTDYIGYKYEYWICVRPSFGLEGKEDSHWVCLNMLPDKNIWHYHSNTNDEDYYLPTGLGVNWEHMQNLAELLYAIYFPDEWWDNIQASAAGDGKLKMFHDFSPSRIQYHNKDFWDAVREQWRSHDVLKNAFNFELSESDFKRMLKEDGIRLLYNGFSWWPKLSWNCTLSEAHYENGTELKEKNMHHVSSRDYTKNMSGCHFDCRWMNGIDNWYGDFFGDQHLRWTVRHATGKELLAKGAKYDKYKFMEGTIESVRYYLHAVPTLDDTYATSQPEVTPAEIAPDRVDDGHLIGRDGKFYRSYRAAQENGQGAVAMVAWVYNNNQPVEKDKDWNSLAIALQDVVDEDGNSPEFCGEGQVNEQCSSHVTDLLDIAVPLDGWAMTKRLAEHACGENHSHPAAEVTWNLPRLEGFSEWFIPSTGQWYLALLRFCGKPVKETIEKPSGGVEEQYTYRELNWYWDFAGVNDQVANLSGPFMSTTEWANDVVDGNQDPQEAMIVTLDLPYYRLHPKKKQIHPLRVRPVIAFRFQR